MTDALELMNNEGITSLPVLDNQNNVIGNISHVDVRVSCSKPFWIGKESNLSSFSPHPPPYPSFILHVFTSSPSFSPNAE